jgi:hypothetical protein
MVCARVTMTSASDADGPLRRRRLPAKRSNASRPLVPASRQLIGGRGRHMGPIGPMDSTAPRQKADVGMINACKCRS